MPTCKYCGKSGFFLSVNKDGLCNQCLNIVVPVVQNDLRIINDSVKIINKSKNLKTRLSRCDVIIETAERLLNEYENKGIKVIEPKASVFISEYKKARGKIILQSLKEDTDKLEYSFEIAGTPRAKINEINKVLLKIQDYKKEMQDHTQINEIEKEINKFKQKAQLDFYLEDAKKAEFKGNKKKALDQYQEALYFLKTDNIEDDLQRDYINDINKKISELSE
jgi:hypothetical protein